MGRLKRDVSLRTLTELSLYACDSPGSERFVDAGKIQCHRSVTRPRVLPDIGADGPNRPAVQRIALASATVNAVMLTMRRTVAEGVRMCTGWAAPSSTGPMAMPPPAVVFSRL